jgi:elongation factor P
VPKACNIKKGNIINLHGQPFQVKGVEVQTPSARGANTLYKIRVSGISSKQNMEQTYKGNDFLEEMDLERRPVSFLFNDGSLYTFMDTQNYEQYTLSEESLEGQIDWLVDGLEGLIALLLNGQIIGIELPVSMDIDIVETAPGLKGASATNRTKPATLANGITVLVPEYLAVGETIRVNTETGRFMSRAKG